MSRVNHKHLMPLISLFLVVGFIALLVESQLELNHQIVSIAVLIYLIANLAYSYQKKQLTVGKILEFGAVALIIELVAFRFLI